MAREREAVDAPGCSRRMWRAIAIQSDYHRLSSTPSEGSTLSASGFRMSAIDPVLIHILFLERQTEARPR